MKSVQFYVILFVIVSVFHQSYGRPNNVANCIPADYTYSNVTHSAYKRYTEQKTWHEAVKSCKDNGSLLFIPENEEEVTEVRKLFQVEEWPIGVSDLIIHDVYETIDGRPLSQVYNKWYSSEPKENSDYHCVYLGSNNNYIWHLECNRLNNYICKIRPNTSVQNYKANDSGDANVVVADTESQASLPAFGQVVAVELKSFPKREKLQAMVSIMKAIQEYWDKVLGKTDNEIELDLRQATPQSQ